MWLKGALLTLFWILGVPGTALAIGGANGGAPYQDRDPLCTHFWERNGALIPSGKEVGQDVGDPPNSSFEKTGTYLCRVYLTESDATSGRYLFIGEVGDASYAELTSINGRPIKRLPINHGLSPDLKDAVYTRYVPFIVSLRDLYVEDGVHEFKIRYKDLFPFQVGIRSGLLTIEPFTGVIKRALRCSPAFTFQIVQILIFLLLAISFLTWPKLQWTSRLRFFGAALVGAVVIIQISAIPRSFLSVLWATRLNDFSQLLSFPIIGYALLIHFQPKKSVWKRAIPRIHMALAIAAVGLLLAIGKRDRTYMVSYGISLFSLGGLPCFTLGYAIRRRWMLFTGGPVLPRALYRSYMSLGVLYAVDVVNLVFLQSRYYYFNHFLFFSTILLSLWYLQSSVSPNELKLRSDLEMRKRKAYSAVASRRTQEADTLAVFTKDLASLLTSGRISIQEIVDGRLRFVGYFGGYTDTQGLHEIKFPSLVADAIQTRKIQYGSMPSKTSSPAMTDVIIIPLESDSEVIGVLCVTDFVDGNIPEFYRERMEVVKHECEPVLSLLISERHSRSKDRLIQMMRNRTHPLQLKSEEYFLKNFDMAPSLQNHAFIYGDLVGSVELNERYKDTQSVEKAIDEHLALVWDKFKHLGVVVSRTKGDLISFVVPIQTADSSEAEAVKRCWEILRYLSCPQVDLQGIGRSHGIALPLQYRFAMSVIPKPLRSTSSDESLKSFNLLVDEAIDSAARVVSGVALDGECLVMEPAKRYLPQEIPLMEVGDRRVKGKAVPIKLWTLNGETLQRVA